MASSVQEMHTLQQKVTELEKQFAELRVQVLGVKPRTKNWERTAGSFPRDEMTVEAEKLGREWRHQELKP